MPGWDELLARKSEMQKDAAAALSPEEYEILRCALELESESRHLAHSAAGPEIRKKLRAAVVKEFK